MSGFLKWAFLLFLCCIFISSEMISAAPTIPADSCSTVKCKAGRVCRIQADGVGACECIQQCPRYHHLICGSNGMTYANHCELHKDACLSRRFISMRYKGACIKTGTNIRPSDASRVDIKRTKQHMGTPVACFIRERDFLRDQLIAHLKSELDSPNSSQRATSYDGVTWMKFYECDANRDAYLDADEFLDCVNMNFTADRLPYGEQTELMRSLCVDAIIDIGDHDRDWKLDYQEFQNAVDPDYEAPLKNCNLEDKEFSDGSETSFDCNQCVCACGHWVCASTFCLHQIAESIGTSIN